jgi:hypothetical protein
LTDEEARLLNGLRKHRRGLGRQAIRASKEVGDYNAAFKGKTPLGFAKQALPSSPTPKDGRIPPFTPEAAKKFKADQEYHRQHPHDGPET